MERDELVVLLDEQGAPIGTASKREVHTDRTPLHLAFSCYLFDEAGRLLLTRRSLTKQTWPGVWTNSFCGHPAPDEAVEDAIRRRAKQELGAEIHDLLVALPDFRYRATDAGGVVENEICPVYTARLQGELAPDPDETAEWAWVPLDDAADAVARAPFAFSPWLVLQLPAIAPQEMPTS